MATLSAGVLALFVTAAFLAFIVPFFREGGARQLAWHLTFYDLKRFAAVLFPVVLLFAVGQLVNVEAADSLRYFALGAVAPFLVARLNFSPRLSGVLILLLAVLFTNWFYPAAVLAPAAAVIAGLILWKLSENLLFRPASTLEDVLPALYWLGGMTWINAVTPEDELPVRQGLLLGAIAVALLIRVIQGPFLASDRLYVKRICLSATGGLLALILITKVLLVPDLDAIAALFGAGLFLTYLLDAIQKKAEGPMGAADAFKALVLIGIFTLLAARLFGVLGWLVLAPATLIATAGGVASLAGAFWLVRTILQVFIVSYNPNVTGVNITHPYAGAALYGGMLLVMLMSVLLRDRRAPVLSLSVLLAAGILGPAVSNYFLHAEPTASLLVSATVAAVLFAVFAPALYLREPAGQENLMLVPAQMIAVACLTHQLIDMGNVATAANRLTVLGYMAGAALVVTLLSWWFTSRPGRKPVQVAGDQPSA